MKVNLKQPLVGIFGEIKNPFDPRKQNDPLTLGELIKRVLVTEKVLKDDRSGFDVINKKDEVQKFDDFKLGMRITDKEETQLSHDEVTRILELGKNFLETDMFGALKLILTTDNKNNTE